MWKIYRNDHSDLNFALGCLYCDAISLSEFKKWIELVIINSDVELIPNYFYDLLDFQDHLFHMKRIFGFDIINDLSTIDEYSIYGISYLRKNKVYESPIDKESAILCLQKNPHILERFKKFFPFIDEIYLSNQGTKVNKDK
ncbi:TPA: hypothetical protein QB352_001861 [Pasteurella multocida]|nr:hypothetical protein [Pasteurella multocida]